MIRVTKANGGIIFDLQNKDHHLHKSAMKKRVWEKDHYILSNLIKYIKNIFKILLRPIKYYIIDWKLSALIIETPSDVPSILSLLSNNMSSIKIFGVDWSNDNPLLKINNADVDLYDRIVIKTLK